MKFDFINRIVLGFFSFVVEFGPLVFDRDNSIRVILALVVNVILFVYF